MGLDTNITWEPVSITNPYTRGSTQCSLCLTEKATIARWDLSLMLNKRSEVMKKCWHRPPHMLNNFLTVSQPPPLPPDPDSLTIIQPPSQGQVLVAPPDDQSPSHGQDLFTPPTPVPADDQPDPSPVLADDQPEPDPDPTVATDEQPLPQRRSNRRKKLVNYQI